MRDVFISYSRKDKPFVERLHQALEAQNRDTWVDWDDIPLTAEWWQEIQRGIEAANTFVFVISPDSLASQVCGREIDHATQHNKRLIPIVYRAIDGLAVHPALQPMQWIFFQDPERFESQLQRLLTEMDRDLDYVRSHTRYQLRAIEWQNQKRNESFGLKGDELRSAEAWLSQGEIKEPKPTELQQNYIRASRSTEDANEGARQILERAVTKAKRVSLLSLLGIAIALGVAAITVPASIQAQKRAEQANQDLVKTQEKERAATERAQLAQTQFEQAQKQKKAAAEQAKQAVEKGRIAQQQFTQAQQQARIAAQQLAQVNQDKQAAKTAFMNLQQEKAGITATINDVIGSSDAIVNGYLVDTLQNSNEAITFFTNFLKLAPSYAPAFWGRGVAYHKKGDEVAKKGDKVTAEYYYEKSVADYNRAVEYSSQGNRENYWSIAHRGVSYRKLRKFQNAIDDFTLVSHRRSTDTWVVIWVLIQRAETYAEIEDYENAIADCQRIIKKKYSDDITANAYIRKGDFQIAWSSKSSDKATQDQNLSDAIADYHKAIDLKPANVRALSLLGYAYNLQGNKKLALEYLSRAAQLDPQLKWATELHDKIQQELK
ncbi:RHS Repeat family protein [Leptolyngbya sp. NIES-3755]|nr:RHS Repeat family protein [Leptolyngbya sp. NIES-3755]